MNDVEERRKLARLGRSLEVGEFARTFSGWCNCSKENYSVHIQFTRGVLAVLHFGVLYSLI